MRGATPPLEPNKTQPTPDLRLLISTEPRVRLFLRNLRDLFYTPELPPLHIESAPSAFWPDVFVHRGLPWRRFFQSGGFHIVALALIWAGSRFLALQPHAIPQPLFTHADVVYYTPSEYLPPLDTRSSNSAPAQKADPEYSAQPIISVPPQADNHSQTLVTPPRLKLLQDVALPNIVAWSGNPRLPIAPAPAVPVSEISRLTPQMEHSIIAPPPTVDRDIQDESQAASRITLQAPQSAVIAPPPALDAASNRRLGEMNIGHSAVIAPAPQLSVDEQRTLGARFAPVQKHPAQVIAPPPALGAAGHSRSGGGIIALSLHPAVGAPPDPPAGNRRGNFAATQEGRHGASGAPGTSTGDGKANGSSSSKKGNGELPSGLYVGKTSADASRVAGDPTGKNPSANSVNPKLIASARPPRLTNPQSESANKLSEPERAVFGDRKVYSLSLNMPNLNSAGGSWIVRFAALKPDSVPGHFTSAEASPHDLSSPVATRKVDPAYPLELMRQNVAGTVILYGVIRADGSVGNVRVLRSVDDRIDHFASEAIAKWHFQPATKDGTAVDVEATFWIPFRPARVRSDF